MINNKKNIILACIGILIIIVLFQCGIGIPCIFHKITGFYCPGCGLTRALISLIKLDFYQAFRYNILLMTLLPIYLIYLFYKYILKGKKKIPNWVCYVLLAIIIGFAILRNIPYFSFLAPTKI